MLQCGSAVANAAYVRDGFRSNEAGLTAFTIEPALARRADAGGHIPVEAAELAAGASSPMKIETVAADFTDEQKRYLEGFTTGLQINRLGRGLGAAADSKVNAETV